MARIGRGIRTVRPKYPNCAQLTRAAQHQLGVEVDGFYGRETEAAMAHALRGYDGNSAEELLDYLGDYLHRIVEQEPPVVEPKTGFRYDSDPPWLIEALKDDGIAEIKGKKHNPRTIELFRMAFLPFRTDETAWCAAAVCAWLEAAGIRSTRNGMAKSFLRWGDVIDTPTRGAIVVFNRGNPLSHYGHVALCTKSHYVYKPRNPNPYVAVFGGNQGDQACHKLYPASKLCRDKHGNLVAFRWPKDVTNSAEAA